ncbi:MAG: hypothetical protein L0229_13575 [Blastocatellia bacterium]|nr:hypothetical protein [Blastocatellia bacterium]
MNCQHFEDAINDLARDRIIDAETREGALAHTETCARCAARLEDERTLTKGLRAMAQNSEAEQAPAHVEAALVAAFRQRAMKPAAEVSEVAPSGARRFRRMIGVAAAVAAILIIWALVASRLESTPQTHEVKKDDNAPATVPPPEEQTPRQEVRPSKEQLLVQETGQPQHKPRRTSRRPKAKSDSHDQAGKPAEEVIATDYIPLTYGESLNSIEGGQLMRVTLPRSVLVSFGLPMNAERVDEPIVADVLVGYDGVAHAIRFVH